MTRLTYQYFNDDELLRVSNKVKEFEKLTAGEIAITIKEHTGFFNKKKPIKTLAEEEFAKLGIVKTRDNTGILIYILLEARQFYILADSAINEKVNENTWETIKNEMQDFFKKGNFAKGLIHGVEEVGKILALHFPVKPDDTNELSDRVIIR